MLKKLKQFFCSHDSTESLYQNIPFFDNAFKIETTCSDCKKKLLLVETPGYRHYEMSRMIKEAEKNESIDHKD